MLAHLLGTKFVPHQPRDRNRVPHELQQRYPRAVHEDAQDDEEDILEHAAERKDEGGGAADLRLLATPHTCARGREGVYQKHDGNIESERDDGIGEQGPQAHLRGHIRPRQGPCLDREKDHDVHCGAHGSKVVQRHEGVHFVLLRAEESLHHHQSRGFEGNA